MSSRWLRHACERHPPSHMPTTPSVGLSSPRASLCVSLPSRDAAAEPTPQSAAVAFTRARAYCASHARSRPDIRLATRNSRGTATADVIQPGPMGIVRWLLSLVTSMLEPPVSPPSQPLLLPPPLPPLPQPSPPLLPRSVMRRQMQSTILTDANIRAAVYMWLRDPTTAASQ